MCPPLRGGSSPARSSARFTIVQTAPVFAKPRRGALARTKTLRHEHAGRPWRKYRATASPASAGNGRMSSRPPCRGPAPYGAPVEVCQIQPTTSPPRRPSRAISSRTAWSRRPASEFLRRQRRRRCSTSRAGIDFGTVEKRQQATAGTVAARFAARAPFRCTHRRNRVVRSPSERLFLDGPREHAGPGIHPHPGARVH